MQAVVDAETRAWGTDQPAVHVVAGPEGLPDAAKRDPGYRSAEGYYDGRELWLVASNLRSDQRVREVLAHEAVGHYDVERVLGPQGRGEVVDSVTRLQREELSGECMQAVLRW